MPRDKKTLLYAMTASFLCASSTLSADLSFLPPTAESVKKVIKEFPGRKKTATAEKPLPLPGIVTDKIDVDLKNPIFSSGVLSTDEGGIITCDGVRIQAKKIQYINRVENGLAVQKIIAEEQLLMEFYGRFFVGDKLEFDLVTKTGTLSSGRTDVGIWFVGGDTIELEKDGSYLIHNAFITTCENQDAFWAINSESVKISKEHILSARNIRLNFFKVPLFWVPSFKSNLTIFSDPPIKYRVVWDKGLGPRATMRYRVLSWQDLNLFFRLDYRLSRGPGAAIESEYYTPDDRTVFITRSYGAYDKIVPEEKGAKRYRLQGLFSHQSQDKKTFTHLQYDKFSDLQMIDDFKNNDFVIDTQKRTRLLVNHQENNAFGTLSVQPQINPFESINEQLPLVHIGVRPFSIANTSIISENAISAGYQKYTFATTVKDTLSTTRTGRIETKNTLYRSFISPYCTFTPYVGAAAIFYSNSPNDQSVGQILCKYGAELSSQFYRRFSRQTHKAIPYIRYRGITQPRVNNYRHYTFDMEDGFFRLEELRIGTKNLLFSSRAHLFLPSFAFDLYTNAYFNQKRFKTFFPKIYALAEWSQPGYLLGGHVAWNFEENTLDFINISSKFTINASLAFTLEYRHRSFYDWRKANHDNFIVDMAHSISELLHSPLSDRRDTALAKMHVKLSPRWSWHIEGLQGWNRLYDPPYTALKTDITTILPSNWQLKLSYMHSPDDDRFTTQIQLVN